MKANVFYAGLLTCILFISCKKDYNCVCNDVNGKQTNVVVKETTETKAKTNCQNHSAEWGCFSVKSTCVLQ